RAARRAGTPVNLDVAAAGVVRATADQLAALRPTLGLTEPFPAALLKHADEQTIAGLAAVCRAARDEGLDAAAFHAWGVLAAPRYFGRDAMVAALERFAAEGAWGVSLQHIPHRSLHSASGTISLALQTHGPNFGVGGGPEAAGEGLLAAAALLSLGRVPALWLVLTGWDREPVTAPDPPPVCQGVALALVAAGRGAGGRRLHVLPGADRPGKGRTTPLSVEAVAEALTADDPP